MTQIDDNRLGTWVLFLRAHSVVTEKLERDLQREQGLSLSWYEVLLHLRRAGHPVRMQQLAQSVLLSKSGLSRLVDRMEAAGLVSRQSCPSDRRGTFVALTPTGQQTFHRAAPVHLRGINTHFASRLCDEDLGALRGALGKIVGGTSPGASGSSSVDQPGVQPG